MLSPIKDSVLTVWDNLIKPPLRRLPEPVKKALRPARYAVKHALMDYYARCFKANRKRVLFIVGHIRAGSTLLLHILNSNPETIGYGETHREYRTLDDLVGLTFEVHRSFNRLVATERYIIDKVLSDYVLNRELLQEDYMRVIFLVRKPQEALPSILGLKLDPCRKEERALERYTEQLQIVEEYARLMNDPSRAFYLTHEHLLYETDRVLEGLQQFLELQQPLSEEYETMWSTGKKRIGDPTEKIKTGRVVRERKGLARAFDPELVEKGQESFERCVSVLAQHCRSIERSGSGL